LHRQREQDRVERHLAPLIDFREEPRKRQPAVARERIDRARALRQEAVPGHDGDDGEQAGQEARPNLAPRRVVEDLDDGHARGRVGGLVDVADAETQREQEPEARDGAQDDGEDDGLGGLARRILHLFGHVRRRVVAAHAEAGLQDADDGRHGGGGPAREVLEFLEHERGRLLVVVGRKDGHHDDDEGAHVPDQHGARDAVQEVRSPDVDRGCEEGDRVCNQHCVPALDGERGKDQISLSEDEVCRDEVVGCAHGEDSCDGQSPAGLLRSRRYSHRRLGRYVIPVNMNQPATYENPRATLGGARMATHEYCPPATGYMEHISAMGYATARVSKQTTSQLYTITGGPPALTPTMKTPLSAVQLCISLSQCAMGRIGCCPRTW